MPEIPLHLRDVLERLAERLDQRSRSNMETADREHVFEIKRHHLAVAATLAELVNAIKGLLKQA